MKKLLMGISIIMFLASPVAVAQETPESGGSAGAGDGAGISTRTLVGAGLGLLVVGLAFAAGSDDGDDGAGGTTGTTGTTGTGP